MTHNSNVGSEEPSGAAETLGSRIRRLMEAAGLNQTSLAAKVGMDRSELNRTINDKRQARAAEIGWIAEALGTTRDELLKGLDLPAELSATRSELENLARRVLDAEAERDRARETLALQETALANERELWNEERVRLVAGCDEQVARARGDAQALERALRSELISARAELSAATRQLTLARAELAKQAHMNRVLSAQLTAANQTVAHERSQKLTTGVLAGLAGALFGGVVGSGGPAEDDEDDYDD